MPSQFIYTGLVELERKLNRLGNLDPTPLMEEWEIILTEGNRRCRLAGLDGYGVPLTALLSKRRGMYAGATGPPLDPFRDASRTIDNFRTAHQRDGTYWVAYGAWEDVLSKPNKKGQVVAFLPFHFRGEGNLPRRDLAHVDPTSTQNAQLALRTWIRMQVA